MNSVRSSPLRLRVAALSVGSLGMVMPALTCAGPVQITVASVAFSNSAALTDSEGGAANSSANTSLGTTAMPKFDSNMGVLTGATIHLNSTRSQSVSVTSTDGPNNGTNPSVTTTGTGSSTARLQAPGVDNTFSSITASGSCTGTRLGPCSSGATTAAPSPTNLDAAVPDANLNDYVGAGSFAVTRTTPSMSSEQLLNKFTGVESTQYTLDWFGDLSATYGYLLHAAPSFTELDTSLMLTLDLGNVFLNDVASRNFDLFNLVGNRVGLDLDSILGTGDTSKFLSNLSPFADLGAGESNSYWVSLVTTDVGRFSASYALTFSDADVGAASSRWDNLQMTLNVKGSITGSKIDAFAPTAPIPEPATLALLGLGLAGISVSRRRKR